jgi:hypothetical protein
LRGSDYGFELITNQNGNLEIRKRPFPAVRVNKITQIEDCGVGKRPFPAVWVNKTMQIEDLLFCSLSDTEPRKNRIQKILCSNFPGNEAKVEQRLPDVEGNEIARETRRDSR